MAGAYEGKEIKERTQKRNDGMDQTFWEICPPLKSAHSRGYSGGKGARFFGGVVHDVKVSTRK
jgi:hypothetical protein